MHEDWQDEFAAADCYAVRGSVVAHGGAIAPGAAVAAGAAIGSTDFPEAGGPVVARRGGHVLALCYDTHRDTTIVAIAPSADR